MINRLIHWTNWMRVKETRGNYSAPTGKGGLTGDGVREWGLPAIQPFHWFFFSATPKRETRASSKRFQCLQHPGQSNRAAAGPRGASWWLSAPDLTQETHNQVTKKKKVDVWWISTLFSFELLVTINVSWRLIMYDYNLFVFVQVTSALVRVPVLRAHFVYNPSHYYYYHHHQFKK